MWKPFGFRGALQKTLFLISYDFPWDFRGIKNSMSPRVPRFPRLVGALSVLNLSLPAVLLGLAISISQAMNSVCVHGERIVRERKQDER